MTQKSLLATLKANRNHVSQAERNVVDYVIDNPQSAMGLSIHELASKSYVSAATITRLCQKIGIKGYREFQAALVYDLATENDTEKVALDDMSVKDSVLQTLFKVTRRNVESLNITRRLNDADSFEQAVELLSNANQISLFGMGASNLAARDFFYKMLRAGITCNCSDDWHLQILSAKNMQPGDVGIAFSYSGMTQEVNYCCRIAKENGGKIISITRADYDTELVKLSDLNLFVAATEPLFRSAAVSSHISQLCIVDVLFTAYVNKNYESCYEAIKHNSLGDKKVNYKK